MIQRRSFLSGILSLGMAPAIVRAQSIMPVKVMPLRLDAADMSSYPNGDVMDWQTWTITNSSSTSISINGVWLLPGETKRTAQGPAQFGQPILHLQTQLLSPRCELRVEYHALPAEVSRQEDRLQSAASSSRHIRTDPIV